MEDPSRVQTCVFDLVLFNLVLKEPRLEPSPRPAIALNG